MLTRVWAWLAGAEPRKLWGSPRMQLVRMAPRVHKPLTIVALLGVLLGAVLPAIYPVIYGSVVGNIPVVLRQGLGSPAGAALVQSFAWLAGMQIVQLAIIPLTSIATAALGRRVNLDISNRVMQAVNAPPGIAHLEDPSVQDEIAKAAGVIGMATPGNALTVMTSQWTTRLAGVGSAVIVARFSLLLAAALLIVAFVDRTAWIRRYDKVTAAFLDQGQIHRRSAWFRDVALTPSAAKEVRTFGLGRWLVHGQHEAWKEALAPFWHTMRTRPTTFLTFFMRGPVIAVGVIVILGRSALRGDIDLGAFTMYSTAATQVRNLGGQSASEQVVSGGVAAIPLADALEKRLLDERDRLAGSLPADGLPQHSIRFEGVTFRYPSRDDDVFNGLDLELKAGRSLAVVGVNGAGKTTLVKLLARLHDPTAGRIVVDGTDLRDIDPAAWQQRIACIFQDFTRYQLPARDNVGFGAPHLPPTDDVLDLAAAKANATEIIEALASRWDTPLSRQLTGGTDLSGGQWQRLALARAMYATSGGAGILVLDEPTANLDVRAEAALYERFLEMTRGLTTVLISHRFSTVRLADEIAVIEDGRVTERGSHDNLLAAGGTYAEMFTLQAARFAETAPAATEGGLAGA